jgi:hypothetical protein
MMMPVNTFANVQIGQRFRFRKWTLDWLSAMGDQIKCGETACMDVETQKITDDISPETEISEQ